MLKICGSYIHFPRRTVNDPCSEGNICQVTIWQALRRIWHFYLLHYLKDMMCTHYKYCFPFSLHAEPCEWHWGEFEECSHTCGGGISRRYPVITREARNGGECPLHVVNRIPESQECHTMECPREYYKHVYIAICTWRKLEISLAISFIDGDPQPWPQSPDNQNMIF